MFVLSVFNCGCYDSKMIFHCHIPQKQLSCHSPAEPTVLAYCPFVQANEYCPVACLNATNFHAVTLYNCTCNASQLNIYIQIVITFNSCWHLITLSMLTKYSKYDEKLANRHCMNVPYDQTNAYSWRLITIFAFIHADALHTLISFVHWNKSFSFNERSIIQSD